MMKAPKLALALALGVLAGCESGTDLPALASVLIGPADTILAPGDSVAYRVRAVSVGGADVDVPIEFEVVAGSGAISAGGVFVAAGTGTVQVAAVGPGGVQGVADVTVSRVTGLHPRVEAFGGLVTIRGAGFDAGSDVFFGNAAGTVRDVSSDGRELTAWVPWEAENGRVRVGLAVGNELTPDTFVLTGGGDDALEPNGFTSHARIVLPFRNPYLLASTVAGDGYRFTMPEAGPLTLRLIDRDGGATSWPQRLVLQLNRVDQVEEYLGVTPAFAFDANRVEDAVISRSSLPAGDYIVRVFVAPGSPLPARRYELRLDPETDFRVPADAFEPNDAPFEAPRVDLPFQADVVLENPWSVDYFEIEVADTSRIQVNVFASGGLGVFLFQDTRSVSWLLSNAVRPQTFFGIIGPFGGHQFACTLPPGVYQLGVLDNAGVARGYRIDVSAIPVSANVTCQSTAPPQGLGESSFGGVLGGIRARPGTP